VIAHGGKPTKRQMQQNKDCLDSSRLWNNILGMLSAKGPGCRGGPLHIKSGMTLCLIQLETTLHSLEEVLISSAGLSAPGSVCCHASGGTRRNRLQSSIGSGRQRPCSCRRPQLLLSTDEMVFLFRSTNQIAPSWSVNCATLRRHSR
jgi:hypothetical protein